MSDTSYYEELAKMPQALRNIALENWDETGRPISNNPKSNVIVALLKKNPDDFEGFAKDMNIIFEKEAYRRSEMVTWYNVFMGGVTYLAEQINSRN